MRILSGLLILALSVVALAMPDVPYDPKIKPPSDEPSKAAQLVKLPPGMKLSLWAAEPMLASPVAFSIDHQGRIYVAETFRIHDGVTDIRGHMNWLDDDLACRTVEDRLAMYRKHLKNKFDSYAIHHDRVRLLEDTKGAGKADRSVVFADGFKRHEDGIGSGVLARGSDVWYTCIPDLWLLRDPKNTGRASERKSLSTGYGIHVGFIGHDLHGLVMGPDGKIYFSIGDRGLNVKTADKRLFYPDMGCVLRCNPDGSELEVFASGLRNPQELAFDNYGNLFTGDNNSDGGDRARWVYLVEGGDSGWRIGYQFGGSQSNRGPWNAEKLWHPQHANQAAWVIPPIANLGDGPSGLTHYPGTGFPKEFEDAFLLADFRGAPGGSGIRMLKVKNKGAGFDLVDMKMPISNVLATDVDFGPDGALYLSDWVTGWGKNGMGRIWKITHEEAAKAEIVSQTKKLLQEGMKGREIAELGKLLSHVDRRIRQEAQFELVARKAKDELSKHAKGGSLFARLHAIWGLAMGKWSEEILALIDDPESEIRAQVCKVAASFKSPTTTKAMLARLGDESPRVRFFAAQALGKVGSADAAQLVALAKQNADADVYIRHAISRALANCTDTKGIDEASKDASAAVRRAVLLSWRHLGKPEISRFLNDADPELVNEAARAINDVPIDRATAELAKLSDRKGLPEPAMFRALNARFRMGRAEDAKAVAAVAARADVSAEARSEAVKMLGDWAKPSGRDRIMGTWRPLAARSGEPALEAMRVSLGGIFTGPESVRKTATEVAAKLGIKDVAPLLVKMLSEPKLSAKTRGEMLRALEAVKSGELPAQIRKALGDEQAYVRGVARDLLLRSNPDEGLKSIEQALDKGTAIEKQLAFESLGNAKHKASGELLASWMGKFDKVPEEAKLDLVEAARKVKSGELKKALTEYDAKSKKDPLGQWRHSLTGGDAEAGKEIFLHRSSVSCLRCHKVGEEGAGEVGPNMAGIGGKQKRDYLLEAIIYPNKAIAKGYETVDLVLDTGKLVSEPVKKSTQASNHRSAQLPLK